MFQSFQRVLPMIRPASACAWAAGGRACQIVDCLSEKANGSPRFQPAAKFFASLSAPIVAGGIYLGQANLSLGQETILPGQESLLLGRETSFLCQGNFLPA
jgi:hypothetical protein